MQIYLSASWKQRDKVRSLAVQLREFGHGVYDFTEASEQRGPVYPPETFPEQFDPSQHVYSEYLSRPEWVHTVYKNRQAVMEADVVILLLPCGVDSTADWALGIGLGKPTLIVGEPNPGERSPVHLWATNMVRTTAEILPWLKMIEHANCDDCIFNQQNGVGPGFDGCNLLCKTVRELYEVYDRFELPKRCGFFKPVDYCRRCGCTDHHACFEGCSWVEPGLCSRCSYNLYAVKEGMGG